MENWICTTCGTQFAESEEQPRECPICLDQRQYVGHEGQNWTTQLMLHEDGFRNTVKEHEVAAINASIDHWQKSAANYLKDLDKPDLIGESRDAILMRMNDANIMVKKLRGEKAQLAAGLVDKERERTAYQEILDWCREIKEARGELSYQRKRDFIELLGVVVTVLYDKVNREGSTYDMRVRLPALQEIISVPAAEGELVNHTRNCNNVDERWQSLSSHPAAPPLRRSPRPAD